MKVLIVTDHRSGGGAEAVALAQCQELKRQGIEARLLTADALPDYAERWRNWRMLYNPAGLKLFKQAIAEFKTDIIHFHNIHDKFSYACLKAAKRSGAKVFLTAHDSYLFYPGKYFPDRAHQAPLGLRFNPFRNLAIRRYLAYVDRIFAVSDALGSVLREHEIKNVTLHNGIDLAKWAVAPVIHPKPTILFIGRVSVAKGAVVAPVIMEKVRAKLPAAELLVLGGERKLPAREMPSAYAAADCLIVPSLYLDPFPTVVLEAGAAGLPVVVTNLGGGREAVLEGQTGFVAPPRSPIFAERIIALLLSPAQAKAMGQKARDHIARNFSLSGQVKKLIQYYGF